MRPVRNQRIIRQEDVNVMAAIEKELDYPRKSGLKAEVAGVMPCYLVSYEPAAHYEKGCWLTVRNRYDDEIETYYSDIDLAQHGFEYHGTETPVWIVKMKIAEDNVEGEMLMVGAILDNTEKLEQQFQKQMREYFAH